MDLRALTKAIERHTVCRRCSENLVKQFLEHPTGPLVTVKCDPLATRKVALMGDAAHAIVPFYGQGMNAVRSHAAAWRG